MFPHKRWNALLKSSLKFFAVHFYLRIKKFKLTLNKILKFFLQILGSFTLANKKMKLKKTKRNKSIISRTFKMIRTAPHHIKLLNQRHSPETRAASFAKLHAKPPSKPLSKPLNLSFAQRKTKNTTNVDDLFCQNST